MKTIKYESETFLPAILQEKFETTIKRVQENKYEHDKIRCTIESLKGDIIRWLAENSVEEIKLKNLSEGEAETGYTMLSDVDAQKEIIIGMKDCEWFVDFELEGLSKIIYDTMEKNGILFYKK